MEVALVVVQVNIFADQEGTDHVVHDSSSETEPGCLSVHNSLCYLLDNFYGFRLILATRIDQTPDFNDVLKCGSQHTQVLLVKLVTMDDIKHMGEGVDGLLGYQGEFVQQRCLSDCVWLSHDQVVFVWELLEGILEEVFAAAVKCRLHTEKRHSEGILCRSWWVWYGSLIIKLLTNHLDLWVSTVFTFSDN